MRRATTIPTEDRSCATNRLNYKSTADYERFAKQDIGQYVTAVSSYTGDQVMQLKNSRNPAENASYDVLLGQLQTAENKLNSYISCIQKDIIQRNDFSSRIYNLQQEVETARKNTQQLKETANEAKERSQDVQNPYSKTTWWETWFPLGRPIQKENVPVLLSVSILMLVFSLGIFLRFAGLELQFTSISTSVNSLAKNLNSRKYP